jgi:hypothetical protein
LNVFNTAERDVVSRAGTGALGNAYGEEPGLHQKYESVL